MLKELFYKKFTLIFLLVLFQGFSKNIKFCFISIFSNNVSPEILGNFQFVLSILMTVSIFSLNGMNISLIAALSKKKNWFFS